MLDCLWEIILQINQVFHLERRDILDRENVRCPHCGESYYKELYSTRTSVYYPPIYKDGVNINPDKNTTTTNCVCLNCGKEFTYSH